MLLSLERSAAEGGCEAPGWILKKIMRQGDARLRVSLQISRLCIFSQLRPGIISDVASDVFVL